MSLGILSFSARGYELAKTIAVALNGRAYRSGVGCDLNSWTNQWFRSGNTLVYVGALGIAVRAIAPHVRSKATDPAVVVVDEAGRFAIAVLSGHLGGANDAASQVARCCGAQAVITTATDVHGLFAVDSWARHQGLSVIELSRIRAVAARLIDGQTVYVASPWPIKGELPALVEVYLEGPADIQVSVVGDDTDALHLVPPVAVLGVGCRRGTSLDALESAFQELLVQTRLYPQAVASVATIDLKQDEPGLLAFCDQHQWPLHCFSAEQLKEAKGVFDSSHFVAQTTGVDNVCERAAVLESHGTLLVPKTRFTGVTLAVALRPFEMDWRWTDG